MNSFDPSLLYDWPLLYSKLSRLEKIPTVEALTLDARTKVIHDPK